MLCKEYTGPVLMRQVTAGQETEGRGFRDSIIYKDCRRPETKIKAHKEVE